MWPGTAFEPTKILRKSRQNLISVEVGIWLHYYIVYMYICMYKLYCIFIHFEVPEVWDSKLPFTPSFSDDWVIPKVFYVYVDCTEFTPWITGIINRL
jgi:hypothetical protein